MKDDFITNSEAEIQLLQNHLHISFLPVLTKEKPADLLSHGCSIPRVLTSNWVQGHNWLLMQDYHKKEFSNIVVMEIVAEIKPITSVTN